MAEALKTVFANKKAQVRVEFSRPQSDELIIDCLCEYRVSREFVQEGVKYMTGSVAN